MTEFALAAAQTEGTGIGWLFNLYAVVAIFIVIIGLAVIPLARQLTPPRDREKLSYRSQKALSLGLIAFGAAGFLLWPWAWLDHFQFLRYKRFTPGCILIAGFVVPTVVVVIGLVYRPCRPWKRGRYGRRPPDLG